MDTPATKQDHGSTRFVEPSLRPVPEQPSRQRTSIGVGLLVLGFVGIVLGGAGVLGQVLLVSGSTCVIASLFAFRSFQFRSRHQHQPDDMHKLYGTNKT
jgi:hypothetical protein